SYGAPGNCPTLDVTLADIERCYEIGRLVGDGNFAVVRECHRRDNGQALAVKIVERSKLIGREHMMQNELSLLGSLCHPRIVRLFAHHHTHTHSYLVMELVSGGDLFEAISERGKFSEAEAGLMVSDMSEALNYIHCRSIVHRDLKPENLLKLGDFGLAMVVTEPVFTICGTPTYVCCLLRITYECYGVAVDVWALGVILYILLCGFPPFRSRDRDQEELFQLIKQGQLHFLSPYWDPISDGLVSALLQPDPTVRLNAQQTLQNPWVTVMASTCSQRALTDKTHRSTAATGAEPDTVQGHAQTNAAVVMTEKTPGNRSDEGEITHKQLGRHEMNTGRGQNEERPPQQQSEETITAQASQIKVHTPSGATPTDRQDSGSKLSDTDYNPGSPASPGVGLNPLDDPAALTDPPPRVKTQSKQNSQQPSPPYSQENTSRSRNATSPNLQTR
uniref:Doublecortin-like kinase 3 n=1 Tax=Sparus aurata TaxID=8175 RepID=A0A671U9H6_SPAAU